jgi:guanylate kinase
MNNKLIIFAGPSGSGKTTLVHHLLTKMPELSFSVSATTREQRANEEHGRDYYFISEEQFKEKIDRNEFVEWEQVYVGGYYGTLKSEIERVWKLKKVVIFDVDVEGALGIKKIYGADALCVMVMPPSLEKLKERLHARATESPESLQKRIGKAEHELSYAYLFDKVIVNDKMEEAFIQALSITADFLIKP